MARQLLALMGAAVAAMATACGSTAHVHGQLGGRSLLIVDGHRTVTDPAGDYDFVAAPGAHSVDIQDCTWGYGPIGTVTLADGYDGPIPPVPSGGHHDLSSGPIGCPATSPTP
jgi:hypothetical protein